MPDKSRMRVDEAVLALRRYLDQSRFEAQQRIDPERLLALRLGCSRETLRRALDILEREGVIWRHQGRGTFIGPRPKGELIPPLLLYDMASPLDLMEARLVIEPALAAAAALSAGPADIKRLAELAKDTGRVRDWREYEAADDAFHREVANITGNPLLAAVFGTLAAVRGRMRWQRRHDAVFRRAKREEYASQQSAMHMSIVEAIAAGDAETAGAKMAAHLSIIRQLVQSAEQRD